MPTPVEGEVERVVFSIQVMTGMEIDPDGAVRLLGTREWQKRSKRLVTVGRLD